MVGRSISLDLSYCQGSNFHFVFEGALLLKNNWSNNLNKSGPRMNQQ